MEEETMEARYWCHMCSQIVNPIIDLEIKCPFCDNGFIEEMSGDNNSGGVREIQETEIDFGADRSLSLWDPILRRMMNNHQRRRRFGMRELDDRMVNDDAYADGNDRSHHRARPFGGEIDLDREFESIIGRRRRNGSATILQLLQGIREGIGSEFESSDNVHDRDRVIHGSSGRNHRTLSSLGDSVIGSGLDLLLQHLGDSDVTRQRTIPAEKHTVEELPTVKICEPLQCSICLEDFDKGSVAKEMPCKHKFHIKCLQPWLELHSSCPMCRYKLPAGETKTDQERSITRSLERNISIENVNNAEERNRNANTNGNGRRFSFLWPLSGLFSSSGSELGENSYSGSSSGFRG